MLKNLNKKEMSYALYGLLLGDGTYRRRKTIMSRILCSHTNKQRFYCIWLRDIFKAAGVNVISRFDYSKKTTFGIYNYSEVEIEIPDKYYFESYNRFFDKNNKKIISQYVIDNISTLGLLFWWLDDGQWHVSFKENKGKRFGYLNTQGFTYEENLMILKMFKNRFDIDLRIHTDNSGFEKYKHKIYYRLYFNATAFRKFYDLLRDYLLYIPKGFYYKFNMQYKVNKMKSSQEFTNKYNLI
jgi:hypothetical protein